MYDDQNDGTIDLHKVIKGALREEVDDQAAQFQGFPNAAAQREAQQRARVEAQKKFLDIQKKSLEKYGVDGTALAKMAQENPDDDWADVQAAMDVYAERKARKGAVKRDASGRFTGEQRGGDPMSYTVPTKLNPDRVEAAKKIQADNRKAKRGSGTTRELQDMLKTLLGL